MFLDPVTKKQYRSDQTKKAQTLIIIIAVMVIAMSVGAALSTRFIKTLKDTAYIDMSSRALAVAEAGAERLLIRPLSELEQFIANDSCGSNCLIEIIGTDGVTATASVVLSYDGNTSGPYPLSLETNKTKEVYMNSYPSNTSFNICIDSKSVSNPIAVSVLFAYGSTGNYQIENYLLESFGCHTIPGKSNPALLRITSIYDDFTGQLVPVVGASIPSQGVLIESTGRLNDVVKIVRVLKTYSYVPSDFDYILYSKSEDEPLSN